MTAALKKRSLSILFPKFFIPVSIRNDTGPRIRYKTINLTLHKRQKNAQTTPQEETDSRNQVASQLLRRLILANNVNILDRLVSTSVDPIYPNIAARLPNQPGQYRCNRVNTTAQKGAISPQAGPRFALSRL